MGTETLHRYLLSISFQRSLIKLNNPLMGTETQNVPYLHNIVIL